MRLFEILFGRRIATEDDEGERVGPLTGVALLGLDALGSASYGPEALLTVLLPLGTAGLSYVGPLTLVTALLIVVVSLSYRQTIHAYPNGGGAYTVVKENLGDTPSLFAAAALALDYLLNAAVAISAGVGALCSAVPSLLPHSLALCLGVLALMTLLNLRGVRSTGFAFVVPTYAFVASLFTVIAIGAGKMLLEGPHPAPVVAPAVTPATTGVATAWLLVRAFANGCTAMTGIEAVSNGVPLFCPPPVVSARRTLLLISIILVTLLGGIAVLARAYGVTATPPGSPGYESVLSRVTAAVVGRGALYHATLASVTAVLLFSANTSFADFPRVCRMLAGDRYLPEAFAHRGRRLAFSHGILVLSALTALLLAVFGGVTDRLIPLFAVGALSAFTASQAGMVAHWRRQETNGRTRGLALNFVGCAATAATLAVVLVSKFSEGGWLTLVLAAGMIALFKAVRRHHDALSEATRADGPLSVGTPRPPLVVVPMRRWDKVAIKGMLFATGFADDVIAVQVLTGDREVDELTDRWPALAVEPFRREGRKPPQLLVLRSHYRQLYRPLLDVIQELERDNPGRQVAVVVPELVEPRWYHYLLRGHTASVLKGLLLFRGGPQIVIISTPWYLRDFRDAQIGREVRLGGRKSGARTSLMSWRARTRAR